MIECAARRCRPTGARRPRARARALAAVAAAALVVLGATGCRSEPPFDRDQALARVLDQGKGKINADQAACYVDRVSQELGEGLLVPDARPAPGQLSRLTSIRIECAGAASIGLTQATSRTFTSDELERTRKLPMRKGDDPALDALWDRCEVGDGLACDQLFDLAEIGSDYEEFGYTCGHRTNELRCADHYVSRESTSTTVPAAP